MWKVATGSSLGAVVMAVLLGGCQPASSEAPRRTGNERGDERGRVVAARRAPPRSLPAKTIVKRGASGLVDRGVFSRFDSKVVVRVPKRLGRRHSSVRIDKARQVLVLLHRSTPVQAYPVRFGFAPRGHKRKSGDGKTPEGRYYICEALHRNLAKRYGARSLRISYPNARDARVGRKRRLITAVQMKRIVEAIRLRKMPPQNTRLGSSIRIHGGGIRSNWTLGCIAMRDADVTELYRHVGVGTAVEIGAQGSGLGDRDADGIPDGVDVLRGGKKLVLNRAKYQGGYHRLRYPMGDVSAKIGVCTDVIVRALRNAGYDLQELMHRHIRANRKSYRSIKRPDRNIDHRRVRDMLVYFRARFRLLGKRIDRANRHTLLPGDIVFLDTLPKHGPDHVGIVSDRVGRSGYPLVINNWTVGHHTQEMDLLETVPVTHHFRVAPRRAKPAR